MSGRSDDDRRIARRERIAELYRSRWNPVPRPGEGLPYTPEDHIVQMRSWLELGHSPETLPVITPLRERDEQSADEYAHLLAEEALR